MAYKQKKVLNEEQVLSFLTENVERIRTKEDPFELNEYRRLFRKAVPFTLRSYFASYLIKEYFSGRLTLGKYGKSDVRQGSLSGRTDVRGGNAGPSVRNDRNEKVNKRERNEKPAVRQEENKRNKGVSARDPKMADNHTGEARASEIRIVLADDVSTTLFLSVGRNRRVYPRDLIGLIMQNVEIEREHIGEIRVLDNYSFVQVITGDAEKIISALNEFEYRGRKLAVSYSRKREEQSIDANANANTELDESDVEDTEIDDLSDDENLDAVPLRDSWISETDVPDDKENNGDIQ